MDILPQLLINALIQGSIYALVACGLTLAYGLVRILNFSHGHLMMVGAYLFYWLRIDQELSIFVSIMALIPMLVALSVATLHVAILPFLRGSVLLPFLTTIAWGTILESVISMVFGVNVKSLSVGYNMESLSFAGIYITPLQIFIILVAVALLVFLGAVVHLTGFGRRIRALQEGPEAAQSLGVPVMPITYGIFTLSVIVAALAGIVIGYETNLQPTMGSAYTLKAFAAMILGGLGNLWGTVFGAFVLALIENLSIGLDFGGWSLPAGYKDAFAYLVILIMLLVSPEGLFGWSGRRKV